jgi:hypothetical protein
MVFLVTASSMTKNELCSRVCLLTFKDEGIVFPSIHRDMISTDNVTSPKNRIFSYATAKTSKLETFEASLFLVLRRVYLEHFLVSY